MTLAKAHEDYDKKHGEGAWDKLTPEQQTDALTAAVKAERKARK